jgi:hypothetical protein
MKMMVNRGIIVKGDQDVSTTVAMVEVVIMDRVEVEVVESVSGFKVVVLETERHGS